MTRARGTASKITAALDDAIAKELEEVYKKHTEDVKDGDKQIAKKGDFLYPLLDRLRVMDRAIKIEAIKAKLPDDEWGGKFNKGAADEK